MNIKNTSEYLKILDEIAEFSDKENLSLNEIRSLNLKKLAAKKFELQEVNKYPAMQQLIHEFNKNKFYLN